MRPAVSVGGTTALDFDGHVSAFDNHSIDHDGFGHYLDAPQSSESDSRILEQGILPLANSFDLNYYNVVGHNDGVFDTLDFDDFLNHDEITQPAPEVQSSDSVAQTTALLQPPFGASTYGCDEGGNAVSV